MTTSDFDNQPPRWLTRGEELKLVMATCFGLAPEPFTQYDCEPVFSWARKTRIGKFFLDMVLVGFIVPAGRESNGEVGFRSVDKNVSPAQAKAYRAELKRLQWGWKWTPARRFRISGNDDVVCLLAEPEKASYRLSVAAGQKCPGHTELDPDYMVTWAAECRNDEVLLANIIVGEVLPVVQRPSGRLTFRRVAELPPADQEDYRSKLRRIEEEAD